MRFSHGSGRVELISVLRIQILYDTKKILRFFIQPKPVSLPPFGGYPIVFRGRVRPVPVINLVRGHGIRIRYEPLGGRGGGRPRAR